MPLDCDGHVMVTNIDSSKNREPNLIGIETRKKLDAIIALDQQMIEGFSFSEVISCAIELLEQNLEQIPKAKKRWFKDKLGFVINDCHVKEWVGMNRMNLLKEIAEEFPSVDFAKFNVQEQRHHRSQIRSAVSALFQFEEEIYTALNGPSHRPKGSKNRNNPDTIVYS